MVLVGFSFSAFFPGQKEAIEEIVSLALKIAGHQRGEDHLQPLMTLKLNLINEHNELEEAIHHKGWIDVMSAMADITYYNACSFALDGDEADLHMTQMLYCKRAQCTVEQAYAACLAKYRLRAMGKNSKDFAAENAAIQQALDALPA